MPLGGSIQKLSLDGIPFNVKADADFSMPLSKFEKEQLATSGEPITIKKKRVREVEGINIQCTGEEAEVLRVLDERSVPFKISFTEADQTTWRCIGHISTGARTTMEINAEIMIKPQSDWEVFTG